MKQFDLESQAFFTDPSATLRRMREEAPVHFHAPLDAFVLTRYADIAHVVRDPMFSVDRGEAIGRSPHAEVREALDTCNRFFGRFMVFADPPVHTRLRASVANAFTPLRMRRLAETIDTLLDGLVQKLESSGGTFELVSAIAEPLPTLVTGHLLGLPNEAHHALQRITDDFFAFFGAGAASADVVLRAQAAIEAARALFEDVVAERTRSPGDDVLSALITSESEAATLSRDELLGVCITLVAGAYGTTTHLIANAALALLENESAREALVNDASLAEGCVEEALRFDGPALSVVRRAREDVVLSGVHVPKNARIYAMLHAANRDPSFFPSPDVFDPARTPNRHLGLGAGVHFCLGASLTRLETARALSALFGRCPDLELAAPPERTGNLSMRGVATLHVRSRALAARRSSVRPRPAPSMHWTLDTIGKARDHHG
jgi:pimeloyl-[acyl-carrier protein] synthase